MLLEFIKQFFRYLLFSGFAAAGNIGSRYLLSLSGYVNYQVAIIIAYIIGMIINFSLNKNYNFSKGTRKTIHELRSFIIIALTGLLLVTVFASLFLALLANIVLPGLDIEIQETISHVIAVGIVSVFNFISHKYLTFKDGIRVGLASLIKSNKT